MVEVGKTGSYMHQEVLISCSAPPSEIIAVEGAFYQQKNVFLDNVKRKLVPKAVLLAAVTACAVAIFHRRQIASVVQAIRS
jgi:hypothetical protein